MAVSRHNLNGEILSAASQLGSLFQKFSFQPIRLKLRYGADPAGRGMLPTLSAHMQVRRTKAMPFP